jgi:hypothetical protein
MNYLENVFIPESALPPLVGDKLVVEVEHNRAATTTIKRIVNIEALGGELRFNKSGLKGVVYSKTSGYLPLIQVDPNLGQDLILSPTPSKALNRGDRVTFTLKRGYRKPSFKSPWTLIATDVQQI